MYLNSFKPLLPPKSAKSREIVKKSELSVQGHPRSLTSVPIKSAHTPSYYSLVVGLTLDVSRTVFEN